MFNLRPVPPPNLEVCLECISSIFRIFVPAAKPLSGLGATALVQAVKVAAARDVLYDFLCHGPIVLLSATVSAARRSVWAALICSSRTCLWSALSAECRALWAALNCCRRACLWSALSAECRALWAALNCSSLWSALSAECRALWAALNCCRRACVTSAVALATWIARLALSRSLRTLNCSSLRSGVSEAHLSLSRSGLCRRHSAWAESMSSSLKHVHCALYTVQYVGYV